MNKEILLQLLSLLFDDIREIPAETITQLATQYVSGGCHE